MRFYREPLLFAIVLTNNYVAATSLGACALAGPDFPPAKAPSTSHSVQRAIAALNQTISTALQNYSNSLPLDAQGTTFSFESWSIHEDQPLVTYHHNALGLPDPAEGVTQVNSDTIYRIGSLSKLLTVYTWLATVGNEHWQQPITNFIPELGAYNEQYVGTDGIDHFDWSQISIGALASQLSGIQKDPALPEAVYSALAPFPGLPPSEDLPVDAQGLTCDTYSKIPCTREAYLQSILVTHPVYAASSQPIYSDMAYSLLALALENITSTPFSELFQSNLISALNLTSTSYETPSSLQNAIIPINDTIAAFIPSLSYLQPGGGYYSSLSDLTRIGRAMLNSTILSPRLTKSWLKPAAFLADGVSAVGAPWEIYQTLPGTTNKTTWMYTKSGDLGGYSSYLILFPDYDAGVSILVASGSGNASTTSRVLADIAQTVFAPAFELAAKEEAVKNFVGEYVGVFSSDNTTEAFEISISIDDDPGLVVANYTVNGVDLKAEFAALSRLQHPTDVQLRLFPSGLLARTEDGRVLQGFRMVRYSPRSSGEAPTGAVFSSPRCQEWFNVGGYTSRTARGVNGGLDEFAFVLGEDGMAEGLQVKTWNRILERA